MTLVKLVYQVSRKLPTEERYGLANQMQRCAVSIPSNIAEGNKRSYVENWWKQFSGLKGVESILQFKNSKGLSGYRVKYAGGSSIDIFFESPDGKYIISFALPKSSRSR